MGALLTAPSMWETTVAAVWRIRSLHLSRTEARYLTPQLVEGVPWEDVWVTMQQLAQPASEGFVAKMGDDTELYGAFCPLPARLQHLYRCRPVEPAHVQQPGNPRLHWMPLAVDGTSRHEASFVHCTLGGTRSPDQLASWWLLGGSEEWSTLYAAAQEVDFHQQLWDASKVVFKDTSGADRETLFFHCADGKAQILMAHCKSFKAEAPRAMVCLVCGRNRQDCLANFGLEAIIDGQWEVVLPMGAIYRHIPAKRRILHYRLHGVLWVTICGISGMRDAVSAASGKFAAVVARNFFQPILDVARMAAKTVTKGRMAKGNDTANAKGNIRLECAAAVQLMRTRRSEALIAVCLEEGGMNNKRVGGKPWGDVCRQWWDNFAKMCIYAWRTSWLSAADLGRLRDCSIAMGKAHLLLEWPKLLWSRLWIDHMYFFASQWRYLSQFSCFTMEGSHRRLKRM